MGSDCLDDPGVLARWLDGTLEPERVRVVDRHLLGGCTVCWGVLRFVSRLRELVGRAAERPVGRTGPRVVLDSEAIRLAIGLDPDRATRRELLAEVGPYDVLLEFREAHGCVDARLDLLALERESGTPPPGPLVLEIRRGADRIARAATDVDGRLTIPTVPRGGLRLFVRGPGVPGLSTDFFVRR